MGRRLGAPVLRALVGRVGGGQGSRRGGRGVRTLASDAGLRESMGVAARERTLVEFFPARMLATHPCMFFPARGNEPGGTFEAW